MKQLLFAALLLFSTFAQAVDLTVLSAEVNTDPLSRGYSTMTAQQVVDSLNVEDRTRVFESLSAKTILESVVPTELMALSEANRLFVISFIGASDSHDPRNGTIAFSVMTTLFPNSVTLSQLGTARTQSISRAQEIGVQGVTVNEVTRVKQ